MRTEDRPAQIHDDAPPETRYAGGALLLGVLGVAMVLIGVMLVAMLQAPVMRPKAIVTGFVLIVLGLTAFGTAWVRRKPRV